MSEAVSAPQVSIDAGLGGVLLANMVEAWLDRSDPDWQPEQDEHDDDLEDVDDDEASLAWMRCPQNDVTHSSRMAGPRASGVDRFVDRRTR